MKDLTGQRFGRLVVLNPTAERKRGYVIWACQCDCGKTVYSSSIDLCTGHVSSCGCLLDESRRRKYKTAIDLTGQRFGCLQAIRVTEERKHSSIVWLCKCDCGKDVLASSADLRAGKITTCDDADVHGTEVHGPTKKQVMAGQRFGRLVLIGPTVIKQGTNTMWECKCDCGNTTLARIATLKSGVKKSCGCLKKEKMETALHNNEEELCGKTFGRLTVIRPTNTMFHGARAWECQCTCGNIVLAKKFALVNGNKRSCGCLLKEWRKTRKKQAFDVQAPNVDTLK